MSRDKATAELAMASDISTFQIFTGVITFIGGRIIYDFVLRAQRRRRLKSALILECVATLTKFDTVCRDLTVPSFSGNEGEVTPAMVRELAAAFVVSRPLNELKELVTLCSRDYGRDVIHFFDRWERICDFAAAYKEAHSRALSAVCSDETQPELRAEYWEQLIGIRSMMFDAAQELCWRSCRIVERFGSGHDMFICEESDGRWGKIAELRREHAKYKMKLPPRAV